MTKQTSELVFLSDVIGDIAVERRVAFVKNLKAALRSSVLEGSPTAEVFAMGCQGREDGKRIEKTAEQREFCLVNTPAFREWLELQKNLGQQKPGTNYPSKAAFLSGAASIHDASKLFRRRGTPGKRR